MNTSACAYFNLTFCLFIYCFLRVFSLFLLLFFCYCSNFMYIVIGMYAITVAGQVEDNEGSEHDQDNDHDEHDDFIDHDS